jgi:hypothetical protein
VSPTTILILYVSESFIFIFRKHIAIFIKPFSKTKANAKQTNLNNANEALA